MIIPYSTGGGYDAYTRLTSQYLPKHLPNDVNVQPQNVTGAGGIIGTEEIFNSEPDGYTNGIINVSKLGRDQIISDVNFDLREITYYGTVALEVPLITVGKHTDIGSWEDFVSRVQNDELTFGTTGPASTTAANAYLPGEVSGEYSIDDVLDNMVVYDGTSEMVQAILREDIDVIAVAYSSALAYVQDGSVEPLLYLSMDDEPPEEVPQATTLATAGVNNGQQIADMVPTRRAFGGPPDIPDERVQILHDAFEATLTEDEEMQAAAEDAGRPITYEDGETTAEAVAGYVDGWSDRQEILDKIQSA
jgi:tripartite-type tricarboxylate transporter receptor subunit TctC